MGDITRHSKGYWRSIFIFGEYPREQAKIRNVICKELDSLGYVYAYNFYGEVKSITPKLSEKAHITFRINFPLAVTIKKFESFLKKRKYTFESHNYDEEISTKMAYVMGTKLTQELLKMIKEYPVSLNNNFFRLMFHGLFNDLHKGYKEEAELYHYLLKHMLKHAFGFKIND